MPTTGKQFLCDVSFVNSAYGPDGSEMLTVNSLAEKIATDFTDDMKAKVLIELFKCVMPEEKRHDIDTLLKLNGDNYKKVAQDLFKSL